MIDQCSTPEEAIKNIFGNAVSIVRTGTVSGGCINSAFRLDLSSGDKVFMKQNSAGFKDMFLREAEGLDLITTENGPRVPRPMAVHSGNDGQFIIMEYLEQGRPVPGYWERFGRSFAFMHLDKLGDEYGCNADNYIGSTPQKNSKCKSWISFFGKNRLGFQIKTAEKNGLATKELVSQTELLIERLDRYLFEPNRPSVLHGDLWSGNAMAGKDGNAVIYDPAAYFGHNEADLAMTELFGRFDERFYNAYNEVFPIDSGYSTRKEIYNLYHILNHLNLFGRSYASQASSILKRLL